MCERMRRGVVVFLRFGLELRTVRGAGGECWVRLLSDLLMRALTSGRL
jgi:hypothetical protein